MATSSYDNLKIGDTVYAKFDTSKSNPLELKEILTSGRKNKTVGYKCSLLGEDGSTIFTYDGCQSLWKVKDKQLTKSDEVPVFKFVDSNAVMKSTTDLIGINEITSKWVLVVEEPSKINEVVVDQLSLDNEAAVTAIDKTSSDETVHCEVDKVKLSLVDVDEDKADEEIQICSKIHFEEVVHEVDQVGLDDEINSDVMKANEKEEEREQEEKEDREHASNYKLFFKEDTANTEISKSFEKLKDDEAFPIFLDSYEEYIGPPGTIRDSVDCRKDLQESSLVKMCCKVFEYNDNHMIMWANNEKEYLSCDHFYRINKYGFIVLSVLYTIYK